MTTTDGTALAVRERHRAYKNAWQRRRRAAFAAQYGYSMTAAYSTGGNREAVLERDGRRCVKCGMTAEEHYARWNRPITVDHIDKDRSHNALSNLQTLCLSCHGRKDLIARLRVQRVPQHKEMILARRAQGDSYQAIADSLGFDIKAIWKWVKRWEAQAA